MKARIPAYEPSPPNPPMGLPVASLS